MALFEYECIKCGERVDMFHSYKDKNTKVCEKCGGELDKIIGNNVTMSVKGAISDGPDSPMYKDLQIKSKSYF
jgi:putative FmdB family regulatory protein